MLREPTIEKLHSLRLRVLAAAWLEQDKSPDILTLTFDERLALLVEAEALARDNTRLAKIFETPSSASPTPASKASTSRVSDSSRNQSFANSRPVAG